MINTHHLKIMGFLFFSSSVLLYFKEMQPEMRVLYISIGHSRSKQFQIRNYRNFLYMPVLAIAVENHNLEFML